MDFLMDCLKGWQWFTIWVIIGIFTFYCFKWNREFHYWKSRNIDTPLAVPLLGTTWKIIFKSQPEIDLECQGSFGKIYGLYMFEKPVLKVAEPDIIKQILVKDFYSFRNRGNTGSQHKIFSKVILFARNDDWKRVRAIASPTFTTGKLKKMYPLINKCCTDFLQDLEQKVGKHKFDLKQLMGTYSMDVIARCAFASNINIYRDSKNEFLRRGTDIFNTEYWKLAILFTLPTFIARLQIIRKLINSPQNKEFFVNFATKVIKHRKDNNEKHNDFLQLLIDVERNDEQIREENDDNEAHHVNEGNEELKANKEALNNVIEKKLTENEISAQCFIFLVAGFETTATTLSYCVYELAINPEIQERLYEETKKAFDENEEIKHETLYQLPFLDAVLSETVRNYPPVLHLEREAMKDVILGDTGIKIEKGVVVEIPVYAIHHDPNNFPDPFAFKPERFMPENRDQIRPYTYIPFGAGPRNCLGMRFALLEAKLGLARILQKFKFSRTGSTDVPLVFNKGNGVLSTKRLIVAIEKR